MPNPQQPELRRSEKGATTDDGAKGTHSAPDEQAVWSGRSGPVPEDNQPGHHPATEQDQPPAEDFVARAGGADTDATRPGAEPA